MNVMTRDEIGHARIQLNARNEWPKPVQGPFTELANTLHDNLFDEQRHAKLMRIRGVVELLSDERLNAVFALIESFDEEDK